MNPLLIYALLSAGSLAANSAGQRKVDAARQKAFAEDAARRATSQAEAAGKALDTTQLLTAAGKDSSYAKNREADYMPPTTAAVPGPGASPQLAGLTAPTGSTQVVEDRANAIGNARAQQAALAPARGRLAGFGDAMFAGGIGAGRNATDIAQRAADSEHWTQDVLPRQVEAAQASGRDLFTVGDLFQLAASIYGPKALSKAAPTVGGTAVGQVADSPLLSTVAKGGVGPTDFLTKFPWWPGATGFSNPWSPNTSLPSAVGMH